MPLKPGEPVLSDGILESRAGTDAVAAGDAVTFSGGEMSPAADTDDFSGIACHDADNNGYGNSALLRGVTVANVNTTDADGAVVEGALLSLSPTAGELYRSYNTDVDGNVTGYNPGPVLALSDEGGTWHSEEETYDVPDGYAVIYVRHPHP